MILQVLISFCKTGFKKCYYFDCSSVPSKIQVLRAVEAEEIRQFEDLRPAITGQKLDPMIFEIGIRSYISQVAYLIGSIIDWPAKLPETGSWSSGFITEIDSVHLEEIHIAKI